MIEIMQSKGLGFKVASGRLQQHCNVTSIVSLYNTQRR